jgi:hypothetical protein
MFHSERQRRRTRTQSIPLLALTVGSRAVKGRRSTSQRLTSRGINLKLVLWMLCGFSLTSSSSPHPLHRIPLHGSAGCREDLCRPVEVGGSCHPDNLHHCVCPSTRDPDCSARDPAWQSVTHQHGDADYGRGRSGLSCHGRLNRLPYCPGGLPEALFPVSPPIVQK